VLWWDAYGGLAFELQCLAKRIISLCASSSGCECNWSVFSHVSSYKFDGLLFFIVVGLVACCSSFSWCIVAPVCTLQIPTKGRKRLEYKRLKKLSYVSCNRQMENRFQKLREVGSKGKRANALILEEFQCDNEWVDINAEFVHQDEAGADHSNSLCWYQVDEAMSATDGLQNRNYTR
jgi:hypothetical protein